MSHRNAPLSIERRRRLVERCRTRPIAHVAAEMGISPACASKWVNRWRRHGDVGLRDRSSAPRHSPNATPAWVIEQIEAWRREHKGSAQMAHLDDFARIVGTRTRHQKTKPYTPRHNGKVERYHRILAEEVLYAREFTSEDERAAAISVWTIHYNYHRPHSGAGGQPPASRLRGGVTNVRPSYH